MSKIMTKKDKYLLALAESIGMESMPVDFDTFVTDPYYCPFIGEMMYDFWRIKNRELFPDPLTTKSGVLVFTGSIGSGKSTESVAAMTYEVYKMTLIKDMRKFFRIGMERGVYIKVLNVQKFKAQDIVDQLSDNIFSGKCPYFARKIEEGNWLLKNLKIIPVKNRKDLISDDVALFHLSELNEFPLEVAKKMLADSASRLWGRFGRGEKLFNLMILDSSSKEQNSPVDWFIQNDPSAEDAFIIRTNQWDPRDGLGFYDSDHWKIAYGGDLSHPPYVLPELEFNTKSEAKKYLKDLVVDELDKDRFFYFPKSLLNEALRDIDTFIQDKAGLSIMNSGRFFSDINRVSDCMDQPMTIPPVVVLDFFDAYDSLYEHVVKDITFPHDKTLFFGLDAGVASDSYGVAIGYVDGYKSLGNIDVPNIVIPMAFEISRYESQQTPLTRVADFIVRLSEDYDIGMIAYDQYQSTETVQRFTQLGFKTKLIQTTRTDQPYIILKNMIYQQSIHLPISDVLRRQFSCVKRDQTSGKIILDHLNGGHADSVDAVCRVANLIFELGDDAFDVGTGGGPGGKINRLGNIYSNLYDNIKSQLNRRLFKN